MRQRQWVMKLWDDRQKQSKKRTCRGQAGLTLLAHPTALQSPGWAPAQCQSWCSLFTHTVDVFVSKHGKSLKLRLAVLGQLP